MIKRNSVKLFGGNQIRSVWDEDNEKWYFSIVDVVAVLTDNDDYQLARNYWKVLKNRLIKEGNEPVTNCNQLKLPAADGKMRMTDVADTEQLLRIIQSIPSPKAEPFRYGWQKVPNPDQMQDPELSIQQAMMTTSVWVIPTTGSTNA
ncbi:MAG: Bro-N domain-containing protein [Anaerovoracaceae bacterium]